MFYRQKILLALIETFGGRLKRTDCEKLLFLFCQNTGQNYYDFFPYRYGGFSLISYHDKNVLTKNGWLGEDDDFVLVKSDSMLPQLRPGDRQALTALQREVTTLGDELIRKAYLQYPYFACKSEIVSRVLATCEVEEIRRSWTFDTTPCLFTIGYEGLSIDAFLNKLIANNIQALVDVRNNPFSMKFGFSNPQFQKYVERVGLCYYHLPELGIPSALRKGLDGPDAYRRLFAYYEAHILPHHTVSLKRLQHLLQEHGRIALTCFEANPTSCHRHKITSHLADGGLATPIIHL
ncbi:MAG: DUF488 family protein [Anaerolineales bacterium]